MVDHGNPPADTNSKTCLSPREDRFKYTKEK
jgi:hypothetical protein